MKLLIFYGVMSLLCSQSQAFAPILANHAQVETRSAIAFSQGRQLSVVLHASAPSIEVTAAAVKDLRDITGAGMMDCKRALVSCQGDSDAALDLLRTKGLAKADKKASRIAAEGKIVMAQSSDNTEAVLLEVNCETDFVAKDQQFLAFCQELATTSTAALHDHIPPSLTNLLQSPSQGGTLDERRQALVATTGENIQVRRLEWRGGKDSTVGCYVHLNRIGVLVELQGGDTALATDIAMHVAAMNPPYAKPDQVPQEFLDREQKVLTEQALESGKPPAIVEKMVQGRLRKYLKEICLVSQPFVKNGDQTVEQLLQQHQAEIVGFTRLVVGEGIEKKQDDLAAEVAKMTRQP